MHEHSRRLFVLSWEIACNLFVRKMFAEREFATKIGRVIYVIIYQVFF